MSSFEEIVGYYQRSVLKADKENNAAFNSNFEEVLNQMRDRYRRVGASEKLRKENLEVVSSKKNVDYLKIFNREGEHYQMFEGEKFKLDLELKTSPYDIPILNFLEQSPEGLRNKFSILAKRAGKNKFRFETNSLLLQPGRCKIEIKEGNETIIEKININVRSGERKIPSGAVFVDRENKKSKFPEGDFLVLDTARNSNNIEKEGTPIIYDRKILRGVDEAILHKKGSEDKKVSGEKVWCLVPE